MLATSFITRHQPIEYHKKHMRKSNEISSTQLDFSSNTFKNKDTRRQYIKHLKKTCPYSMRSGNLLTLPEEKSSIGLNSIIFRGALAWNNLPKEIKEATTLNIFKSSVKKHKVYCLCNVCS